MPNYAIPPWIGGGADPAQHFSVGMQMGVRLGAEQAAQQFQQQQLLRQQQQDEFERQYKNTVLQMQVDEATQKQQALSDYQQLVDQGVPAMEALQQIGPRLTSPDKLVALEQTGKLREAQMEANRLYHAQTIQERELNREERKREADTREARLEANAANRIKLAAENAVMRDPALKTMRDTESSLKSTIEGLSGETWSIAHPLRTQGVIKGDLDAANKSLKETQADIAARERAIRSHFAGLGGMPQDEEAEQGQEELGGLTAGDNTEQTTAAPALLPAPVAAPGAKVVGPKRFRFTNNGFVEVK